MTRSSNACLTSHSAFLVASQAFSKRQISPGNLPRPRIAFFLMIARRIPILPASSGGRAARTASSILQIGSVSREGIRGGSATGNGRGVGVGRVALL